MNRLWILRLLTWLLPVVLTCAVVALRRPPRALMTGALVALSWSAWSLVAVNVLARHFGWWDFAPGLPSLLGVPIEPLFGWCVLWGAAAQIGLFDRPVALVILVLIWADLIVMPMLQPLLVLGDSWLVGEALAIAVVLLPATLFSRWTVGRTNLTGRAALQVITAAGALLWIVPSVAIERIGGWSDVVAALGATQVGIGVQLAFLPAAMGLRAVSEFVHRGGGTPIPYDPPVALVESGPYAYVRNPMQLSMIILLGLGALVLRSPLLLTAAAVAAVYSAGLAEWHESVQLGARFGGQWTRYRAHVRAWIPRCRPYVARDSTLFVAFSCGTCSSIGRWLLARKPSGLRVEPAETAPARVRVTYVPPGGPPSEGVVAIAHALEHIHLGWALVAWFLMLPGVRHVAQLLADVCGPGKQVVAGRAYDPDACGVAR